MPVAFCELQSAGHTDWLTIWRWWSEEKTEGAITWEYRGTLQKFESHSNVHQTQGSTKTLIKAIQQQ